MSTSPLQLAVQFTEGVGRPTRGLWNGTASKECAD
jgi:hypothetical protein